MDIDSAIRTVLDKQCQFIGIDIEDLDYSKPNWFLQHTWTLKQQNKFVGWLARRLYKDVELRSALSSRYLRSKEFCFGMAKEWAFQYGWRLSDGETKV